MNVFLFIFFFSEQNCARREQKWCARITNTFIRDIMWTHFVNFFVFKGKKSRKREEKRRNKKNGTKTGTPANGGEFSRKGILVFRHDGRALRVVVVENKSSAQGGGRGASKGRSYFRLRDWVAARRGAGQPGRSRRSDLSSGPTGRSLPFFRTQKPSANQLIPRKQARRRPH